MQKIARRARDRREQRDVGERVGRAGGRRAVAGGEAVEHGAELEGHDLVAADLAGLGVGVAGGEEGRELHEPRRYLNSTDDRL